MSPMLVLDTDHLTVLDGQAVAGAALQRRLEQAGDEVVATIVSAEEQLRGWLARIHALRSVHDQTAAYTKLQQRLAFYAEWTLLPWTAAAADRFVASRKSGIRIGTMDLKIACIALEHGGIVLSQNLTDFGQMPGLQVESWL
jgi:tRNA(fMet)-specific endonuclease VapC